MLPTIIPMFYKTQSEVMDIHGYMSIAMYIHYFLPGSLKLRTKIQTVKLDQIAPLIDRYNFYQGIEGGTRRSGSRWFQKGEFPYPGYCRSPWGTKCLPNLCNCEALDKKYKEYLESKKAKSKRRLKNKNGKSKKAK